MESSSLNLSQSNLTACGSSNNQESPSKWTCSMCTFVNTVKCSRCAQCTAKRESDCDSSSHVQEQINALSIKDVDPELTAVNNRTSPLRSNSLSGSRTNLGAAGNRISPVDNKCYTTNKWPCSVRVPIRCEQFLLFIDIHYSVYFFVFILLTSFCRFNASNSIVAYIFFIILFSIIRC